mmetsp:Transcript_6409/g.26971  ORF Transcript_6409/g.26971 Transcript_6409/m.26971 type:complete len:201 (-) Transcript_6409:879-1481(-)
MTQCKREVCMSLDQAEHAGRGVGVDDRPVGDVGLVRVFVVGVREALDRGHEEHGRREARGLEVGGVVDRSGVHRVDVVVGVVVAPPRAHGILDARDEAVVERRRHERRAVVVDGQSDLPREDHGVDEVARGVEDVVVGVAKLEHALGEARHDRRRAGLDVDDREGPHEVWRRLGGEPLEHLVDVRARRDEPAERVDAVGH